LCLDDQKKAVVISAVEEDRNQFPIYFADSAYLISRPSLTTTMENELGNNRRAVV
jgi:hypothetical protein